MTQDQKPESGNPTTKESFKDLFESSIQSKQSYEGKVVRGLVVRVEDDAIVVDVGLKSEGRISLKEFEPDAVIEVGSYIEVFVERYEDQGGQVILSREKAKREETWVELEKMFSEGTPVIGTPQRRVKGGFTVDLGGVFAFLPGSQLDVRPMRNVNAILGVTQPFQILKMERKRANIVISRKAILEKSGAGAEASILSTLKEGDEVDGIVKNITNYGAFIDLGGVDGLLHVTDASWSRINHPSEILQVGQNLKVKVIRINPENGRISLGIKQMQSDPWGNITGRYDIGKKYKGKVTNITDYGAFVELEPGIEGLVHVSEMSWTRSNIHPNKLVSINQEVEVVVMDIEVEKRRISLGIKQCLPNPWEKFAHEHKEGDIIEGEIKGITDFGFFVGLTNEIDGMIRTADISWNEITPDILSQYKKGVVVKAKILTIDVEKERVALGIKQLENDPFASMLENLKKGDTVSAVVTEVHNSGIDVSLESGLLGHIRRNDLGKEADDQDPSRFNKGDKVEAIITQIDGATRRLTLSIKALEVAQHKKTMSAYTPATNSGTSFGDILEEAMQEKKAGEEKQDK